MLKNLHSFFSEKSSIQISALCFLMMLVIGIADHLSGFEISFSIFYLAPISVASWYAGRNYGVALSIFSAVIWLVVDHTSGHHYSSEIIPFWNGFVRLAFFIVIALLISSLQDHLKKEEDLARTDTLTNLMNAHAFDETLKTFIDLSKRKPFPSALAFIDLDNFKTVNDTLGHSEGDRVLQNVASTIKSSIRVTDLAARLGGDEFVIYSPETTLKGAKTLFEKLRKQLLDKTKKENWPIGFRCGFFRYFTRFC